MISNKLLRMSSWRIFRKSLFQHAVRLSSGKWIKLLTFFYVLATILVKLEDKVRRKVIFWNGMSIKFLTAILLYVVMTDTNNIINEKQLQKMVINCVNWKWLLVVFKFKYLDLTSVFFMEYRHLASCSALFIVVMCLLNPIYH